MNFVFSYLRLLDPLSELNWSCDYLPLNAMTQTALRSHTRPVFA